MSRPRPLWRWWLFCAAFWLAQRTEWGWSWWLFAWACRPWMGSDEGRDGEPWGEEWGEWAGGPAADPEARDRG